MPQIHPEPMNPALLADLIETYEDDACTIAVSDRTVKLLQHIRHLELEVERAKYDGKCATDLYEKTERSYRLLEADCVRILNQAKGKP